MAVDVPGVFVKPRGQAAEGTAAIIHGGDPPADEPRLDVTMGLYPPGVQPAPKHAGPAPLTLTMKHLPPEAFAAPGGLRALLAAGGAELRMDHADAAWLASSCPALAEHLPARDVAGASLTGWARLTEGAVVADVAVNADALPAVAVGSRRLAKRPGTKLRARLRGRVEYDDAGGVAIAVSPAEPVEVAFGASRLTAAVAASLRVPVGAEAAGPLALGALDVRLDGRLSVDDDLAALLPELGELLGRHGVGGEADVQAVVSGDATGFAVDAVLGADGLTVARAGPVAKPAGMPASAAVRARLSRDGSRVDLERLSARLGEVALTASGAGRLEWAGGVPRVDPAAWSARASISTRRAASLGRLATELAPYDLAGDVTVDLDTAGELIRKLSVRSTGLSARAGGRRVTLAGGLLITGLRADGEQVSLDGVTTDGVRLAVGENRAWVLGDLRRLGDAPAGRIDVLAGHIDAKDLTDWAKALEAQFAPPTTPPAATRPATTRPAAASQPATVLSPGEQQDVLRLAERTLRTMREALANADVTVRLSADRMNTYDASVDRTYHLRRAEALATVKAGRCRLSYEAGLNGGPISGDYAFDLSAPDPAAVYTTTMTRLIATENLQPQIAKFFPGNNVEGLFSRREEAAVPLVRLLANAIDGRVPPNPEGHAVTVTTEGWVAGQAAPNAIAKAFPSLKETVYRYTTMTGFADLRPDGSADNDMIFEGKLYDLYIEGATGADNIGRYAIGLLLFGRPQSPEWNHRYKLGRIPLMYFTARIEGGQMHDVQVTYVPPHEVLAAIAVTHNPLLRALDRD